MSSKLNIILENEHFSLMGHYGGRIFCYSHRSGDFISFKSNEIPKGEIRRLAPMSWWQSFCPPDKNSLAQVVEFAAEMICRASETKGIFDIKKIRGCGAWMDEGKAIFHLGTKILIEDQYIEVNKFKSKFIYPIKHDLMIKNSPILQIKESVKLVNLCNKLSWEDKKSGMLFAGWLFMAPLCGALHWRSHIYILGGPGTGKSYVMSTLIPSVLGELPLKIQGSSTEAGIRQYLNNDARPIIFDEAEGNDQYAQFRLQSILSLARQASTPDGAPIVKGTNSQEGANTYFVRSCFAMSSIELPIKEEADKQRFTILRLKPFPNGTNIEKFKEILKYAEFLTPEYSSGLLSRGLKLLPIIRESQRIFMEVGEIVFGKRRIADQMSMMLAGLWHLCHDEAVNKDYALKWLLKQEWREQQEIAMSSHDTDLLRHILDHTQNYVIDNGGQISRSLREIIDVAVNGKSYREEGRLAKEESLKILRRNGFRINETTIEISNKSEFIKNVLKGTHWNYPCHESLARIPGALKSGDKNSRFDNLISKYVSIPLNLVLEETLQEEWEE